MHIDSSTIKRKHGQEYTRHLLRESYREGRKVKKRTIANLSHCSDVEIAAIKLALRHKHSLLEVGTLTQDVEIQQGTSFGATYIINSIADRLGVSKALGSSREGKLALWQVIARVMSQGSRLSAVRLAEHHNAAAILGLDSFNEDHLYQNLDWLSDHQEDIERSLFKFRHGDGTEFFLYDITSSYLEGTKNELADWGYNRDKKNGKMQIVVGLLCDSHGLPVSIEVFEGSTSDCSTVKGQLDKIAKRWNCPSITMVGDKGMLQGPQIEEIETSGYSFITTIRKSQIEPLVVSAGYQTTLIDENLLEIIEGQYRYVFRRNPVQAELSKEKRQTLIQVIAEKVRTENIYLGEHPKANPEKALERVTYKIEKFKLQKILSVRVIGEQRMLELSIDEAAVEEEARLDGCYAMKSNISIDKMPKEDLHEKYKELALVEDAFRCSKTELLEMRPVHVRLEKRTRGHVFVVMLAYLVVKELERCWKLLDMTVEEALDVLKAFQTIDLKVKDHAVVKKVPKPNKMTAQLFKMANVPIPEEIPSSDAKVVTRKKIGEDRK